MRIHQDARLYASVPEPGTELVLPLAPGRIAYLHLIRGAIEANGVALSGGDALKIRDQPKVELRQANDAELLLFDLPD